MNSQVVTVSIRSVFDDVLFISQAESLVQGSWLGDSFLAMAKGPFYPLWLAFNHLAGLPLLVSQALLYVIACWAIARALSPALSEPWTRAALYVAVLYNPASWDSEAATRIIRENIYPSLTLLLFASSMGTVLRIRNGTKASVPWAVIAGFTGVFFNLTREEGIWVLPSLVLMICWGVASSHRGHVRTWMITAACAALAYAIPASAVAYENWRHYGIFETCETTAKYFNSAYGALTRVKSEKWNPYVPVPREARRKIFAVSPAYREVGRSLEGSVPRWVNDSKSVGINDDIAGGWFLWAFRVAIASTGKYKDGMSEAREWYRQMTVEINEACRNGQLDCLPSRSSLAPPWHNQYLNPFLSSFSRAGMYLASFKDVTPKAGLPSCTEADLLRFEAITGERIPRFRVTTTGLLSSRFEKIYSYLRNNDLSVDIAPLSEDSSQANKGHFLHRFNIESSDYGSDLIVLSNNQYLNVPLFEGSQNLVSTDGSLQWTTERYQMEPITEFSRSRDLRIRILAGMTKVYSLLMPLLAVISICLLLLGAGHALRTRSIQAVPLFSLALMGAIIVRLFILSFIDVSSFHAITVCYLSPAYAIYVTTVMLVLIHEREKLMGIIRRKPDGADS